MPKAIILTDGTNVEVIRARRKTMAISIREGQATVRAPRWLSESVIHEFVTEKAHWIQSKLKKQHDVRAATQRKFVDGESFNYMGRNYNLRLTASDTPQIVLMDDVLYVALPTDNHRPDRVKNALLGWYKQQAGTVLKEKVARFADQVGRQPSKVTIRTCKSRWGSCSASGRLMFNWKIMMATEAVIDYLVVHELCHLLQANHSPRYWREVERVLPDFRSARDWLKRNGGYLEII